MSGLAPLTPEQKAKNDAFVQSLIAGCLALAEQEQKENVKSCDVVEPDCTHKVCSNSVVQDGATAPQHESGDSAYRQVMDVHTKCAIRPGEGELRPPFEPPAEKTGYDCIHVVHTIKPASPCATTPPNVHTMCAQNGEEVSSDLPDSSAKSVGNSREKLTEILNIRLTPAEKSALKSAAEAAGFRSMADFLRSKIPNFAPVRRPKRDAEIKKLMASHGAIGSNINQIARQLNSNKAGNVVDVLAVLAALQDINEKLDEELNKIVGEEK